jgi:hypothetical protein
MDFLFDCSSLPKYRHRAARDSREYTLLVIVATVTVSNNYIVISVLKLLLFVHVCEVQYVLLYV